MDTEEKIGGGPAQTKFYFPGSGHTPSIFKQAVYTPFPTEPPAPFHHNPSQRIILLTAEPYPLYLVVRVGPLLELSRDHGGTEISWDDWKNHLFIPRYSGQIWWCPVVHVFGCQLIITYRSTSLGSRGGEVEVFDFSEWGCSKYLSKEAVEGFDYGVVNRLPSVGETLAKSPRRLVKYRCAPLCISTLGIGLRLHRVLDAEFSVRYPGLGTGSHH